MEPLNKGHKPFVESYLVVALILGPRDRSESVHVFIELERASSIIYILKLLIYSTSPLE